MITFEKKSDILNKVRETVYATKDKRLSVDGHGQFIGVAGLVEVLRALGLVEWKEDDDPKEFSSDTEGASFISRLVGRG